MKIKLVLWIVSISLLLTSCNIFEHPRVNQIKEMAASENALSEEIFNNIMVAIEEENIEGIRVLLAQDANEKISDEDIQKLFDFFEGDVISVDRISGSSDETSTEDGKITDISETWEVATDVETYTLSFDWYRYNYENPESIGVQIIELNLSNTEVKERAPYNKETEEFESGIYVQKEDVDLSSESGQNSEKLARKVIELMENDDIDGLKDMLSVTTLDYYKESDKTVSDENYTLDGQLKALVHYYEGDLVSLKHNCRGHESETEDLTSINRVRDYWEVETTEGLYLLFIAECRYDKENSDNVGVYQIGITTKEPDSSTLKSWEEESSIDGYDEVGIYLPDPFLDDKVYNY